MPLIAPQAQHLPRLLLAVACAMSAAPAVAALPTLNGQAPIVIGHRGASGYLPEHTLESYARAIDQGASFIEPDLVLTKDGFLIARHEPFLDGTTDVASKFGADRRSTRLVDGDSVTAYYANDFTLAEIKTLRAVQPRASRDQSFNGQFEIPTIDEIIALAQSRSTASNTVGIYPEIKHSTFFQAESLANGRPATYFEDTLVAKLHAAYGNTANAPVFIQSFETTNLRYLNAQTDIKLAQLIDANDVNNDGSLDLSGTFGRPYDLAVAGDTRTFADLLTTEGLNVINDYADGIGPWKPYLVKTVADGVDRNGDGAITINDRFVEGSTGVIERAHAAGLLVHAFTFRDDASGYGFTDPQAEIEYYFRLGTDGVFTDFPDTGVAALAAVVPEPETYALMLGGLAMLGALARRRRG